MGRKDLTHRKKVHVLFILAVSFLLLSTFASAQAANETSKDKVDIYFFYGTTCPYCAAEKKFLEGLEKRYQELEDIDSRYGRLRINYLVEAENWEFFLEMCKQYNTTSVGVPRTFIGDTVFVGFDENDCEPVLYQGYAAYMGCQNLIENSIRRELGLPETLSKLDALQISRKNCLICNLTASHPESIANVVRTDDLYLVAWWTPERIKSDLNYPDLLVRVDARTGEVLGVEVPESKIPGLVKPPLAEMNYLLLLSGVSIILLLMAYMVFGSRVNRRYWVSGLAFLVIIFLYNLFESMPAMNVVEYAKQFSFPIFTFIVALVDGFNPCAFAVLAFLLSVLTHTKSRKKMLFIGSIFILTSGFMYFLFIMVLLFLRTELLGEYKEIIRILVALIAGVAGLINIKDFFFFKKGVSLTMSAEKQGKVFQRVGKLVREVNQANSKRDLLLAGVATVALAALVNLVELGCTFILPMEYIETMLVNYPENPLAHGIFTAFYAAVYVIPLFAILGSFIYSFKSERVTETQGRLLKLVGGLIMLGLSLILLFKPEMLMFGS